MILIFKAYSVENLFTTKNLLPRESKKTAQRPFVGVHPNPTNIFACCRVSLSAAGGGIVAAGVAT